MDRLVETEADRKMLLRYIERQKLPFVNTTVSGKHRSIEQNRLMWMWAAEAAEQNLNGLTAPEIQAHWKAMFGLPILCADDPRWAPMDGLPWEQKLVAMRVVPVTSVMKTRQLSQFLDEVYAFCTEGGIKLTIPEDLKWKPAA